MQYVLLSWHICVLTLNIGAGNSIRVPLHIHQTAEKLKELAFLQMNHARPPLVLQRPSCADPVTANGNAHWTIIPLPQIVAGRRYILQLK